MLKLLQYHAIIKPYKTTWILRAFCLVKNLWVIVPVNSENCCYLQLFYKSKIYLSSRPHFLRVYWRNKLTWDVARTLELLVNHSLPARDLQAFRVFSQHPRWVYYASKPIKNVVYGLNKFCGVLKKLNWLLSLGAFKGQWASDRYNQKFF